MSDKINDEKYISIEYDVWITKYQPLEQENERLKLEVEQSKIKVEIFLGAYSYVDRRTTLGYVEFDIKEGWNVRMPDLTRIKDEVRRISNVTADSVFISKERADELVYEWKSLREQQEITRMQTRNLPRIIKWLFKIK